MTVYIHVKSTMQMGHCDQDPATPEPSTTKNSSSSRAQKSSPAKLAQRTHVCEMRKISGKKHLKHLLCTLLRRPTLWRGEQDLIDLRIRLSPLHEGKREILPKSLRRLMQLTQNMCPLSNQKLREDETCRYTATARRPPSQELYL